VTPLFKSPCDFADRMPTMAAEFLELETQIGRRFREDSVTDILIASLLKIGGSNATVFTPPEAHTGGDFDLVIYRPATGNGVQYRIQAKRVVPNATHWEWSSYRELDHPHGQGKQSSTLVRSSAQESIPTIPLYAFYNPLRVCAASNNQIDGIQLADGRAVNVIVRALVKAKADGKRPRWKRVEYLQHLFFPLATILCPPADSPDTGASIIQPEVSREAVLAKIKERQTARRGIEDAPPRLTFKAERHLSAEKVVIDDDGRASVPRTPALRSVPKVIERAIERGPEKPSIQLARIKRPKLVLLSR